MTKKSTAETKISEDEQAAAEAIEAAEFAAAEAAAEAAAAEQAAKLEALNAARESDEAQRMRSAIRAEAAGVELNEHGVPIGIDLTFEETMRMHRAQTILGTTAEQSESEDAPAPRRKRR